MCTPEGQAAGVDRALEDQRRSTSALLAALVAIQSAAESPAPGTATQVALLVCSGCIRRFTYSV